MELRKLLQEADSKDAEENETEQAANPGAANPGASSHATCHDSGVGSDDAQENEEELCESFTNALPTFVETFWSLTAHDITGTLDKVIERVLGDQSITIDERQRRAEALQELGTVFVEEAEASRQRAPAEVSAEGEAGDV